MTDYNKLVRDKIPEIIVADGYVPETRIVVDDAEYLLVLTDKLCEEAAEVKENPSLEELADATEALLSIGKALGYSPSQIEAARVKKAEERGGFDSRIFLISTSAKE